MKTIKQTLDLFSSVQVDHGIQVDIRDFIRFEVVLDMFYSIQVESEYIGHNEWRTEIWYRNRKRGVSIILFKGTRNQYGGIDKFMQRVKELWAGKIIAHMVSDCILLKKAGVPLVGQEATIVGGAFLAYASGETSEHLLEWKRSNLNMEFDKFLDAAYDMI